MQGTAAHRWPRGDLRCLWARKWLGPTHYSSALASVFQPLPVTHSPSSSTSCHSLQPLLFPPSLHSRSSSAFVLLSGSSWWDLIHGPSYPQHTQMCWVESLTWVPLNLCLVHWGLFKTRPRLGVAAVGVVGNQGWAASRGVEDGGWGQKKLVGERWGLLDG